MRGRDRGEAEAALRRGTRALFVGLAAAATLVVGVAPLGATESTIYPGVGIGKVALGMTRAQVERSLGRDAVVNDRETYGGKQYVELGYAYSFWSVAFTRTAGRLRVVQVSTTLRSQKTTTKIGIGTAWRRLAHTYPHGLCAFGNSIGLPNDGVGGRYGGAVLEYLVPHRGGTQTIFMLKRDGDLFHVFEVHVRKPFTALGEFKEDSPFGCRDGWADTDVPLQRS